MLQINNLSFRYPRQSSLTIASLSLQIPQGGVYGMLGANGTGKSTLLYLIAGLLTPRAGSVEFQGQNTRLRLPQTLQNIFMVPEQLTLPQITFNAYVKFAAPAYPNFSATDLAAHLKTFEMSDLTHRKLTSLSMGQQKKMFMCFALACNTPLLLMDEPTNGLDIPSKAAFRRFIASACTEDRIIIISTHQAHDIELLVDNLIILHQQNILLDQPVAAVLQKLSFLNTSDPQLIARALYSEQGFGGYNIVLKNDGSTDTDLNLELLYKLTVENPTLIKDLFTTPHAPQS